MDEEDLNASYERQLSHLKLIIPNLACPYQVKLCSVWIARFKNCKQDEEFYRSKLVNLFVRQLRENRQLGEPFVSDRNIRIPLKDVFRRHVDSFLMQKDQHSDVSDNKEEEVVTKVNQALAKFEYHLGQIETNNQPYENLKRLQFMEFLDMGVDFRPIMERVQHRWNRIFENINRRQLESTTPHETCPGFSSSSSTSSELGQCGNICTDPRHLSTPCIPESRTKYKAFTMKYAKRVEKMKSEIAKLRQNAQIQAKTESIRFAALKSELVERTGAKQQAEMCAMIDQLDERYREIIANSMALGVAETKRAKAT